MHQQSKHSSSSNFFLLSNTCTTTIWYTETSNLKTSCLKKGIKTFQKLSLLILVHQGSSTRMINWKSKLVHLATWRLRFWTDTQHIQRSVTCGQLGALLTCWPWMSCHLIPQKARNPKMRKQSRMLPFNRRLRGWNVGCSLTLSKIKRPRNSKMLRKTLSISWNLIILNKAKEKRRKMSTMLQNTKSIKLK